MKKLFYNSNANTSDVTDNSGKKTKAQIVNDFGGILADWKEISFDETVHQCVRIADGTFEKKTHVKVQQELEIEQEIKKAKDENDAQPVLAKLGITKDEARKILKL